MFCYAHYKVITKHLNMHYNYIMFVLVLFKIHFTKKYNLSGIDYDMPALCVHLLLILMTSLDDPSIVLVWSNHNLVKTGQKRHSLRLFTLSVITRCNDESKFFR